MLLNALVISVVDTVDGGRSIFVLDKQDWMSPCRLTLEATRNTETVSPLIRDDSNVGAALIHSAFRDIARLTG